MNLSLCICWHVILCSSSRNYISHPVSIFHTQIRVSLFLFLSSWAQTRVSLDLSPYNLSTNTFSLFLSLSFMHKHVFPSFSPSPSCSVRKWMIEQKEKKKGVVSKQEKAWLLRSWSRHRIIPGIKRIAKLRNKGHNGARMFGKKIKDHLLARPDSLSKPVG